MFTDTMARRPASGSAIAVAVEDAQSLAGEVLFDRRRPEISALISPRTLRSRDLPLEQSPAAEFEQGLEEGHGLQQQTISPPRNFWSLAMPLWAAGCAGEILGVAMVNAGLGSANPWLVGGGAAVCFVSALSMAASVYLDRKAASGVAKA